MSKNNESNLFIKNDDNISKQRQNLEEQKSKVLLRIKKSISMNNNLHEFKNRNANINQSLESNINLKKEKENIHNNNISKKKL